ncbi:hypothetical protein NDU88_001233 [Pleurodeles waltl]|uniref:Uncharacterized protein n=1 Tax=Pleurodeles waltl TaxID=8319 RepID=A0AAV7WK93_PLEWA|nr:hypothetical protein NDU88_001233 [Pleurodeles waltl]
MGRKTGKDEAEAGTLEPPEADDRRQVFGPAEQDPASAPVRRTSMASAASNGQGITRMIFYFIWNSKMDRVKREVMFKTHDKGGKGEPDIATILRGIFVCHCVRNTLRAEDESHAGFLMARFFLLPTNRLVVGKKETSTLGCRKMIHSLLRDYAALDGSDDDSDDEI